MGCISRFAYWCVCKVLSDSEHLNLLFIKMQNVIVNSSLFVSTSVSITSIIFQHRYTVFCRLAHSSECGFIHGDARLMYPTFLLMERVRMPGGIFQTSRLETISSLSYYCLLFCYMTCRKTVRQLSS